LTQPVVLDPPVPAAVVAPAVAPVVASAPDSHSIETSRT